MMQSQLFSFVGRVPRIFQMQKTCSAEQVPIAFREPGITRGYRLPSRCVWYYIASVLQMNNETVNVWTHIVGFFLVLARLLNYLDEFSISDQRIWPLLGFGLCCLLYTSFSVCAHVLHSKSPVFHYTCYQFDYAGIGLYLFGGALPVFCHGADPSTRQYFQRVFLPANMLLSWFCFVCCCFSRLLFRRPYPLRSKLLQVIPFGIHGSLTVSLLAPRMLRCYQDNCDDRALEIYKNIFMLVILSGITFSSHFPEKVWPGVFDIVGQGHHIFHIISTILTLRQFDAAYEDAVQQSQNDNVAVVIGDLSSILGMVFSLCVCCVITILLLRRFVKSRTEADKSVDKQT